VASRTKFDSLLEAVPNALVGTDQSGVIRFVNHQTEELFGHDRDDLVGQHVSTLLPESVWVSYLAYREGHPADPGRDPGSRPGGLNLELSVQGRDGRSFPVYISLSPIDTGDLLFEVIAARHVKSQQRAFEDSERMTAIIVHSGDAIIGKTLTGTITSWNPTAERMYGYSSEEIIGRSIDILAPSGRSHEIAEILARVRAGLPVENFETKRVRKDGSVIAVSISVSPIRDQGGVVVGASTIARDVTKLTESFETARAMIEASLDSLVSIGPEGRITDVNETTVQITGVPREELIGTAFPDYFTDPEKAEGAYQRAFAKGMPVDYPLTICHRDGTLTEVLYNASVYRDAGGRVLGVFAAARDVTRQMQAQLEIAEQQARELDRLAELEAFHRLTVGRELQMIKLKKEIEYLRRFAPTEPGNRDSEPY
jgi:PAS domain S-box-containing protein